MFVKCFANYKVLCKCYCCCNLSPKTHWYGTPYSLVESYALFLCRGHGGVGESKSGDFFSLQSFLILLAQESFLVLELF